MTNNNMFKYKLTTYNIIQVNEIPTHIIKHSITFRL